MKLRTTLALGFGALWMICFVLMAAFWPAKAHAGYCAKWSHGIRCSSNYTIDFGPSCRRVRRCLHWVHSDPYRRYDPHHSEVERRHYRSGRDYEIVHDRRDERRCLPEIIVGLSDPKKNEDEARVQAIQRWMASTQWSGGGGEFMNFDIAKDKQWRCGPTDAADTIGSKWSKRIARAAPGLAGSTDPEGRNIRCQLWARPCKAPRERDDGDGR